MKRLDFSLKDAEKKYTLLDINLAQFNGRKEMLNTVKTLLEKKRFNARNGERNVYNDIFLALGILDVKGTE